MKTIKIAPDTFDARYFSIPIFVMGLVCCATIFIGEIFSFAIGLGLVYLAYYLAKKVKPTFTLSYDEKNEKVILERKDEKVVIDILDVVSIERKSSSGGYWPYQMISFELTSIVKAENRKYKFVIFGGSSDQLKHLELLKVLIEQKQKERRESGQKLTNV